LKNIRNGTYIFLDYDHPLNIYICSCEQYLEGFWFLLEDLFVCHVEISETSKTLENINWPKEEEEEETKAGTHEMEPTPKSPAS
jgi:hypothetical protein